MVPNTELSTATPFRLSYLSSSCVCAPLFKSKTQTGNQTHPPPSLTTWKKKCILKVWFLTYRCSLPSQCMRTRMYEESDLNLQRKDLLAGPWATHTSLQAACLPLAIRATGSSSVVSGLSKTPVLLQGHLVHRPPRDRQALIWAVGFLQSVLFLRLTGSSFPVHGGSCPRLLGCGDSWWHFCSKLTLRHRPPIILVSLFEERNYPPPKWSWVRKASPKVPHSPISSSM